MYCYIFCFLPLYLYLLTAAPVSVLFVSLITPLFYYKHLFFIYIYVSAVHSLSFSWQDGQLPKILHVLCYFSVSE